MEFVRIENRNTWIEEIPSLYPYTSKWINFWKDQKQKCIEGKWRRDFDGYRYMTGPLHFYIHFCTLVDWDSEKKMNKSIRPLLRDIEWEFSYLQLVMTGFSGFEDDDHYSCHLDLKLHYKNSQKFKKEKLHYTCFKKDGSLKEYVNPIEYVRKVHSKPLGKPLYENEAFNGIVLGSRGGGKSYYWALAGLKHSVIFDGKRYNIPDKSVSDNFITAFHSSKSGKTIKLIPKSIAEMKTNPNLGCYSTPESDDFVPHPFFKQFNGSLAEGNGGRPYAHRYRIKSSAGGWSEIEGSKIVHGIITPDNPETSAGERNDFTLVEEVGLIPNIISFHLSNEATQKRGVKFGKTCYIGTAGNMKKIRETRQMFVNPSDYDIVQYYDDYENSGMIGLFLPAYYTDNRFKDNNGNTNIEEAKEFFLSRREKKKNNPDNLRGEIMNYPLVPSEMFISDSFNVLPANESAEMEKRLLKMPQGATVDLFWIDSEKVDYRLNNSQQVPYPFRQEKHNAEGTIVIYDFPIKVTNSKGEKEIPKDAYVIGFDPYATDMEKDARNSFGAAYVMLNPKYYDQATSKNIIVASYIARPRMGRKVFLENLEKLIAFYGNPTRGLWYENDRGDHVKDYFEKNRKLHLLSIDGLSQQIRGNVTRYGWNMGNHHKKLDRINELSDFLKEAHDIHGEKLLNVQRIVDIHLHREIIQYDIDSKANYDRLVALIGCVVGIRNIYNEQKDKIQKKESSGRLDFLTKRFNNDKRYRQPSFI